MTVPVPWHSSFLVLKPWETVTLLELILSQLRRLFHHSVFMREQMEKHILNRFLFH